MSSASRATNRSQLTPATQNGRLARLIYYTYLPICLVPMLLLGGLVFWVVRTVVYKIAPTAQATPVITQFGLVVLAAVLLTAALTLAVSLRASRRLSTPLPELVDSLQKFLAGNLDQRLALSRKSAARGELRELVELFNRLADDYRSIYNSLSRRDLIQKDSASTHEQSIAQVVQAAVKANSLDELLQIALQTIAQDFSCLYGAAYLMESRPGGSPGKPRVATLAHSVRSPDFTWSPPGPASAAEAQPAGETTGSIEVNPDGVPAQDWLGSQAITAQRAMMDSYYHAGNQEQSEAGAGMMPGYLEAAIPILWGGQTLGVLDLISSRSASDSNGRPFSPFSSRSLAELQKIADVIALAMAALAPRASAEAGEAEASEHARPEPVTAGLTASSQTPAGQLSLLFQASQAIARAETPAAVSAALAGALDQSPYPAAILLKQADAQALKFIYRTTSGTPAPGALDPGTDAPGSEVLSADGLSAYFSDGAPILLTDLANLPASPGRRLPQALMDMLVNDFARRLGCASAGLVPLLRGGELAALLVLGRRSEVSDPSIDGQTSAPAPLTTSLLAPYASLTELAVAALVRISSTLNAQHKLAELQIISNISQAISLESNLAPLYPIIHQQLESVMGRFSSFAIALYDAASEMIRIPYLHEEGELLEIPPFPMGEGLTSIVLRTRKPLLLAENVEEQSNALGAKVAGPPARSWLGVPMLYAGEAIGAIIVQDIRQEHRFDEGDQNLLSTLAMQVAVVVRNARLLESTQRRAAQERYLNEITARIRRAPDIQSILKTTAEELGAALAVQRAQVRIGAIEPAKTAQPTSQTEAER
jgi:GAF domain-containing protein/HAMP domain-containing protein